jgi:hypothetical protein
MKAIRTALQTFALWTLFTLPSVSWSDVTDAGKAKQGLDDARLTIKKACNLQSWQFALTLDPENLTRVELSPTISSGQMQCVYQTLSDDEIPLDRPAPIQVRQASFGGTVRSPNEL